MRVIINPLAVRRPLINGQSPLADALEQLLNRARCGRIDQGSLRSHDIDSVMPAPVGPGGSKCVLQLGRLNSGDWNGEAGGPDFQGLGDCYRRFISSQRARNRVAPALNFAINLASLPKRTATDPECENPKGTGQYRS